MHRPISYSSLSTLQPTTNKSASDLGCQDCVTGLYGSKIDMQISMNLTVSVKPLGILQHINNQGIDSKTGDVRHSLLGCSRKSLP
jgi:hypothetical protein